MPSATSASCSHGITPSAAGTWSAPGRVNLIGDHTDYNGGFVFPFAIGERTHVALRHRDDGRIRVVSTFDADPHLAALTTDLIEEVTVRRQRLRRLEARS